jgi:hypothetical protein
MADYGSLPFAEAIAYLKDKIDLATEHWDDIRGEENDHSFIVAGAAKADLLADLHGAVLKGLDLGTTIEDFRRDFEAAVATHGWTGWTGSDTAQGRAWRTATIYETNLRTSYQAGRRAQHVAGAAQRPYLQYHHADGSIHPRPLHVSWNGTVLAADDPWWDSHYTPNGWRCRCYITSLADRDLKRLGKTGPDPTPDDGTYVHKDRQGRAHVLPAGIDYGWDHAPGATRNLVKEVQAKAERLPEGIGRDLRADVARLDRPTFAFWGARPGLADLPPATITALSGVEFGADLTRPQLALHADALLRGWQGGAGLYNTDTGWMLGINKTSRKKMGDNAGQAAADSKIVAGLGEVVRHAVVAERHPDTAHHNPLVKAILRLYAPVTIGRSAYRVKLTVKEYQAGAPILHALESAEIENAPPGIFPTSTAAAGQSGQPTTGRLMSIADLLRGVTTQDGTPVMQR